MFFIINKNKGYGSSTLYRMLGLLKPRNALPPMNVCCKVSLRAFSEVLELRIENQIRCENEIIELM